MLACESLAMLCLLGNLASFVKKYLLSKFLLKRGKRIETNSRQPWRISQLSKQEMFEWWWKVSKLCVLCKGASAGYVNIYLFIYLLFQGEPSSHCPRNDRWKCALLTHQPIDSGSHQGRQALPAAGMSLILKLKFCAMLLQSLTSHSTLCYSK